MRYASRTGHAFRVALAVMVVGGALLAATPRSALAISPTPNATMTDVNSSDGYPTGNGAGIIEALGMIGPCSYAPYTESDVESTAISWIDAGHNTIIEVTPQTGCSSSVSNYEQGMENVYLDVQSHVTTTLFNEHFGGFMLDEEPYSNFWYIGSSPADMSTTATQLGDMNLFAYDYLDGSSLGPYSELANAGGYWSQGEYNTVAFEGGLSVPAPQIYNTNMVSYQNSEVGTDGQPTLVTCHNAYLSCTTAEADTHGSSFEYLAWGSVYWRNVWNAA